MQFPLDIRFKIIALASQIYVRDNSGNDIFYVKQKMFKLKENIEIYSDSSKSQLQYVIKADRVIDFSPVFTLYDNKDGVIGSVKRHGAASLWRARYTLELDGKELGTVQETNGWVKVWDGLFGELPIVGMLSGYVFHPKYNLSAPDGTLLAELAKQPALFEGVYKLNAFRLSEMDETSQRHAAALLMMVTLMERTRG